MRILKFSVDSDSYTTMQEFANVRHVIGKKRIKPVQRHPHFNITEMILECLRFWTNELNRNRIKIN